MHDPARPGDSDESSNALPADPSGHGLEGNRRLARLMSEIAERLRPVCADWEEERFQTLVRQIAELERRWLDRETPPEDGRLVERHHPDPWHQGALRQDGDHPGGHHREGHRRDGHDGDGHHRPRNRRDGHHRDPLPHDGRLRDGDSRDDGNGVNGEG